MRILNYGSMNIDNVYSVRHIVKPGETILANQRGVYCGGKGLNQSIAIAKAGGDIYHAGVLGEDGGMLLNALQRQGVRTELIKQAPGPSSHTVIQVDDQGQNSIIVYAGEAMRFTSEELDEILQGFGPEDILILQNELHGSPLMMQKAKQRGLSIIFNPSPVNEDLPAYPLGDVDWFLLNEVEGAALTGETDAADILAGMRRLYPRAGVVLTLGGDGAYCLHEGNTLFQPAFPVRAVDTTAAGDTFTGYFVTGLSRREALPAVLERSAKAAAIAVGRKGAADSIPYASELA